MTAAFRVLTIVGAIFAILGGLMTALFVLIMVTHNDLRSLPFALIPFIFVVFGICFIAPGIVSSRRQKTAIEKGIRYQAKIYGYTENTSVLVNGKYPIDTKVHFFNADGVEREVILNTGFARGSNDFPIGMTIDIFEYNGKYYWDKSSVRDEAIPGEKELMDNVPVDPSKVKIIACECPNCGATFQATIGYANRCPYCDSYLNV